MAVAVIADAELSVLMTVSTWLLVVVVATRLAVAAKATAETAIAVLALRGVAKTAIKT